MSELGSFLRGIGFKKKAVFYTKTTFF